MVHALRETHRVLKPDGLLLDLRPGAVHRRVGIIVGSQYRQLAVMTESLQDDYAANRAVSEVIQKGWYKLISRIQVNCNRTMALTDFADWLSDFATDRDAEQKQLIRTVERAFVETKGKTKKVIVKGPLVLRILKKIEF
jgi:ubiquinone/menaquinone biosynthesis C-methylase UbiE